MIDYLSFESSPNCYSFNFNLKIVETYLYMKCHVQLSQSGRYAELVFTNVRSASTDFHIDLKDIIFNVRLSKRCFYYMLGSTWHDADQSVRQRHKTIFKNHLNEVLSTEHFKRKLKRRVKKRWLMAREYMINHPMARQSLTV